MTEAKQDHAQQEFLKWEETRFERDEVFADFFQASWRTVYLVALLVVQNEGAAEEIANEALLAFYVQAPESPRIEDPVAFLCTIARRMAINRVESEVRRKKREDAFAQETLQTESRPAHKSDDAIVLREWFDTLSAEERLLLFQRFDHELRLVEIGEKAGRSADSVRMQIDRLLTKGRLWFEKRRGRRT